MKTENNSENSHSNTLGPIHIWALGVGVVLVGQFMGWNLGIMKGGSIGSLLACWIIGILYVCLIMVNTEMGTFIPEAGGQYAMAKYFMGPLAAFNIGLMLVFEYVMLEAADALVVGELLKSISNEIQVLPFILLSLLSLTYLNYKGSHGSMNVNIVLTAVAFATILILLASTKFYSPGESLIRLRENINGLPYGWMGILGSFQFGCWFYLGIEGTVLASSECKSKNRAIPVGAMAGLMTLMIGATITWFVCSGLMKAEILADSIYPLFDAAKMTGIPFIAHLLFIGTMLSCLASANGCITDASRAWCAMSEDTLIPKFFSAKHPVYGTPYRAIVFLLPIAIAFGFTGLLDQVVTFSILSALLVYLFTAYMMVKFRKMYPLGEVERGYTSPLHPLPSIILAALAGATLAGMYFGYWINIFSGIVFYMVASVWFVKHRSKHMNIEEFTAEGASYLPRPKGY
ncbi:MAG TPA: amino acid permease [Clostridia bacterium]|nr:amino acid permease [Clostridia bacterium]